MDMKLHMMIDLIKKKCSAQESVSTLHFLIFELFPFVNFHTLFLSRPFLLMYNSYGLETS
jgi:hypothetical protein